jgi:hypothetical protein
MALKDSVKVSTLSLKGEKPAIRDGALNTSDLHAQGSQPSNMKAEHSIHDLDGATPPKYLDNPPQ